MKIEGRTAVVTGGASGIGKAICQALAANGARVCLIDVNAVQGEICADELKLSHGQDNVVFVQADVSSQDQLEGAFAKAKSTFGQLDIVVNNAGIVDENDWRTCVNVNMVGVISGTRLAVDCMSKINGGSGGVIISMASVAGLLPGNCHYMPTYSATKAAVLAHTIAWSTNARCQEEGIRFNAICPKMVNTPFIETMKSEFLVDMSEEIVQYLDSRERMEPSSVAKEVMDLIEDDTKNGVIIHLGREGAEQVHMEYSHVMINGADH